MRRVIRRALGLGALALVLWAGVAGAVAPAGPRLALVRWTAEPERVDLISVDQRGAKPLRLAGGGAGAHSLLPFGLAPLSWSPDGTQLAFSALPPGFANFARLRLLLVNADGTHPRTVPGVKGAYTPVFSPDGRTLAFTRFRSRPFRVVNGKVRDRGFVDASIWTADLLTGAQRRLTPWRDGLEYIASSFSPDGSMLLATRFDQRRTPELVALRLHGGSTRVLADGLFPVYSPDGSEIALFRERGKDSDLYVLNVASGGLRRLTQTPRAFEFYASWDPSGERLAFVRFGSGISQNFGNSIMQINADGSCLTKTLSAPGIAVYVPAWQPGPGREAGRIDC
jgi:Tol biopolymer transport system component